MANIKGFFTKVRNLKKEDIKEHFKKRKERRQMILEKRRNGKFAKKMQPVYKWMNRLSVPLQFLLACIINFFIEVISRLSFGRGVGGILQNDRLCFCYNSCMIFVYIYVSFIWCEGVCLQEYCSACSGLVFGNLQRISADEAS